jgi:hypothetical protein
MAVDVLGAVLVFVVVVVNVDVATVGAVVLATVFVWAFTEPPIQAVSSTNAKAGLFMEKLKFIVVVFKF